MHAPQIIYIILTFIGLGYSIAKHGQPRDNHDFGVDLISTIIVLGLLYWGGFFSN